MKLTCVTAVFNAIKSGNCENLIRCVNSVAALKIDHEHLIYDGASTDGTVELLRDVEKKTPGLKVVSEKDTGIYNALNKGVRDAQGEWFYVLGCDDYLCVPGNMDSILTMVGSHVSMVVAGFVRGDYNGVDENVKWYFPNILTNAPHNHQSVIIRTDVVRWAGGFDERYRIAADADMMQKIHHAAKEVVYVKKMIACYGAGGVSECNEKRRVQEVKDIIRRSFSLSQKECELLFRCGCANLLTIIKFMRHKDYTLRYAARHMLLIYCKLLLRKATYPVVVLTRPIRHRNVI